MKRYSKLFSILVLCSVFIFGYTSCLDDDGYSLDGMWEAIVTVNKIGDNTYDFTLDNGKKLWVAAPAGLNLKPEYDRAIINYTILSDQQGEYDHYIKLNDFRDILTKGAIFIAEDDKAEQDSIGHDPIKVYSIWEGGGYLNIGFGYNSAGVKPHMLNLVSTDPDLSIGEDIVKLEFRHNQNADPQSYPARGYVSFDITPYKIEGKDKVVLEITSKDFSGEVETHKIEYKYKKEEEKPEPEG